MTGFWNFFCVHDFGSHPPAHGFLPPSQNTFPEPTAHWPSIVIAQAAIDHWLLISLKDSNMQATVTMKNYVFIMLRLVWAIRPIWWMGWYDLIVGV